MARLTDRQIKARLRRLDGWAVNSRGELETTYTLPDFAHALMFVTAVGVLAESAQHHPDMLVRWNRVTLSLTTHEAGGLTAKDFDLATRIGALPH